MNLAQKTSQARTIASDADIEQEWQGIEIPASLWCPQEAPHMSLREFKHTYRDRERVLSLLILESAEPQAWDNTWQDEPHEEVVSSTKCNFD